MTLDNNYRCQFRQFEINEAKKDSCLYTYPQAHIHRAHSHCSHSYKHCMFNVFQTDDPRFVTSSDL